MAKKTETKEVKKDNKLKQEADVILDKIASCKNGFSIFSNDDMLQVEALLKKI